MAIRALCSGDIRLVLNSRTQKYR